MFPRLFSILSAVNSVLFCCNIIDWTLWQTCLSNLQHDKYTNVNIFVGQPAYKHSSLQNYEFTL